MKDWFRARDQFATASISQPGAASRSSSLRSLISAVLVLAVVWAIKLRVGDDVGREAPFALLGLGVLAVGWVAGAAGALLTTVVLTLASWYLFLPPYRTFAFGSTTTTIRLSLFFMEGLAISGIVAAMSRARRLQGEAVRRLGVLQALTAALAVARTSNEVGEILVKQTAVFLGATSGVLVLPTTEANGESQLYLAASQGDAAPLVGLSMSFPADRGIPPAKAFRTSETEWIENRATYVAAYPGLADSTDATAGGAISLPLFAGGRVLGAVSYHFARPRRFSEAEKTMIRGCVTQAAQALDRTLASSREGEARRRLEALADVSMALSAALNTAEVSEVIVERGRAAMGADTCTLYALNVQDQSLELIGHRGVAPEVLSQIARITDSSGNPSFASLVSGKAVWNESEEQYRFRYPRLASIQSESPRARASWSVPLVVEGHAVGLLGMGFYQERHFPADERTFIETFTGHCSQSLLRAQRLEAELSARRAAERAEASLATTLRSIGDAVIATDTAGNITFMNPIAEKLTGWAASDGAGRPLGDVFRIVNEETRKVVENPVDKVLHSGLVVGLANHTVLLSREPVHETPIDDSGAPIRDESGTVQGVVLVFRDVSEKKSHEARQAFVADATATLASSLDYQTTLVRLAELLVPRFADWSAVDIVDPESETVRRLAVTHVDPAKVRFAWQLSEKYPEPVDSSTGVRNVLRTGRSEMYAEITEEMVRAAARDEEHLRLMLGLQLRSGMIVPLVARGHTLGAISVVHAESGRRYTPEDLTFVEDIARRAAVVIDNAQLYSSERQARVAADVANRTKDEFLATVSHELRTPLNAILGWARMMAKSPSDEHRRARAIEVIERNSVAMAQLIEDLLDISRIMSGKVRLEVEQVDLTRVIQAAVDSVRPSIDANELQLRTRGTGGDASPPMSAGALLIPGDSIRLQQVLVNLLSNAVKFTPNGGTIFVATQHREGFVEIEVTDTGKGIDPIFLPHVFDPFRQADGSITRAHGGLGLGLTISRHLVGLHGGKIWARSDGLGRGATFVVSLPTGLTAESQASPSDRSAPQLRGEEDVGATLRGLKVLAVDDDADARQLVRYVLEERGAVVTLAANANEALQAFLSDSPDVLLSDIGMPGEDGYALIRKVRSLPLGKGGDTPAAALTAYTRAEDRQLVLEAGYSAHLPKPIEPNDLIAVVAKLARRRW